MVSININPFPLYLLTIQIKADRGEAHTSSQTIQDLQKETEKLAEQKHKDKK